MDKLTKLIDLLTQITALMFFVVGTIVLSVFATVLIEAIFAH